MDLIKVNDYYMYVYPDDKDRVISNRLRRKRNYEPVETKLIRQELKSGDVFLDLGANMGYYTILASRIVGKKGIVIAFEPEAENFQLLKANVEYNQCINVILELKAVSNKNEKGMIFLSPDNMGDHRIYAMGGHRPHVLIDVIRLDDYEFLKTQKVDFIKMDIQGAEPLAMEGMLDLLDRNKKLKMMLEFEPDGITMVNRKPKHFLKVLEERGFGLNIIDRLKGGKRKASVNEIMEYVPQGSRGHMNLLCEKNK